MNESDILVCIGDETDEWIEELVKKDKGPHLGIIRFNDSVAKIAQGDRMLNSNTFNDEKMDYHFWLSLREDLYFCETLEIKLSLYTMRYEAQIKENWEKLSKQLDDLDKRLIDIVEKSKTKEIVVADKFPFEYFVFDYQMMYTALGVGCNADTEIKQEDIEYMINRINKNNISTIFYTDMGDLDIVNEIVNNTGCQAAMLHSLHNVSKEDFDSGITMLDLFKANVDTIESVLCE